MGWVTGSMSPALMPFFLSLVMARAARAKIWFFLNSWYGCGDINPAVKCMVVDKWFHPHKSAGSK
jgi:hypothetical protein